ncbi:MAG TPA: hypothetical protein VF263_12070 [Longimicrobiaceae bacterium]
MPTAVSRDRSLFARAGLAFYLLLASTGVVGKYLGAPGMVAYAAAVLVAVGAGLDPRTLAWARRVTPRMAWTLFALSMAGLAAAFAVVFPWADGGGMGGGSDRDEALDLAVRALLRGDFPYHQRTYLGGAITPLPGAFLLAAPFVVIWSSALQNLFWVGALFAAAARAARSAAAALPFWWIAVGLSPVALQEVVVGGDFLTNALYVALFTLAAAAVTTDPDAPRWLKLVASVGVGVAVASRLNYGVTLALLAGFQACRLGVRGAAPYVGASAGGAAAVFLPFYLYDPGMLQPTSILADLDWVVYGASRAVPALAALLAVGLALGRRTARLPTLLWDCAAAQSVLVLAPLLFGLSPRYPHNTDLRGSGLVCLGFAVLAAWLELCGADGARAPGAGAPPLARGRVRALDLRPRAGRTP